MTRETRIGLVVGLLFIIAFGLVLSELTGTPSTPSEQLATNSETPDGSPVPISTERPLSVVRRPLAAEEEPAARQSPSDPQPEQQQEDEAPVARRTEQDRTEQQRSQGPRSRTYTVQSGDTLSGIAEQFYGSGRHYRRILEANADRISSPESISVGQELIIPAPSERSSGGAAEMSLDELRRHFGTDTAEPTQDSRPRTHTVRSGDNLTRIARQYYGDGGRDAVMRIYNANRDVLSTPDALPVGATLEIPR